MKKQKRGRNKNTPAELARRLDRLIVAACGVWEFCRLAVDGERVWDAQEMGKRVQAEVGQWVHVVQLENGSFYRELLSPENTEPQADEETPRLLPTEAESAQLSDLSITAPWAFSQSRADAPLLH